MTFEEWYEQNLKEYVTGVYCEMPFDLTWIETNLKVAWESGFEEGYYRGCENAW